MGFPPQGSGSTDNEALREIRDILKESKKQTRIMVILTILIVALTLINIAIRFN